MNIPTDKNPIGRSANEDGFNDDGFDQAMRAHYVQALAQLPANTRARLRAARHDATTAAVPASGAAGWKLAGVLATVFAFALGLQHFTAPPVSTPMAPQVATTTAPTDVDLAVAALDENPDLYLWLAANDDALPPLPEQ